MQSISFPLKYLFWHYTTAFANIFGIWRNYFWFVYNFFSLPILAKTLFAKWHRISENYKKGLDLESLAGTIIVNTLMRVVGFVMRSIVILIGLVSLAVVAVAGALFLAIWVLYPFLILGLLARGLLYLFQL